MGDEGRRHLAALHCGESSDPLNLWERVGPRVLALGMLVFASASFTSAQQPGVVPTQAIPPAFDPTISDVMRADARLNDVCFVDPQRGWAVGDRGAIWHTEDGGKHWLLQESGVGCALHAVFFLTADLGWAAGGFAHPYTHTSTGVVLLTRNGGRRWDRERSGLLPALRRVGFFDERRGWAVGAPSALFPSGVFVTEDGGRSWSPLPGEKTLGWRAADLVGPYNGALAGRRGTAAFLRSGAVEPVRTLPFGLRSLTRIELVAPVYGWLIGEGGLVMMTGDLGATWQVPPAEPPPQITSQFDFYALEVRGPKAWIAGSPGTRVLHSPDAGRSWIVFSTRQPLPLRGLSFPDDQHGWAVGDLGTILATADGGQTWVRQRAGGARAALLALFSEPKNVPLELLARLSGNEGYLATVETLNRRDWEVLPRADASVEDRLHEAVVGVGACGAEAAWQFPLRQAGLKLTSQQIVRGWDLTNDNRGLEMLEAHLVRQIRLWRPEVVVTHDASPQGDDPAGELIHQAVLRAVQRAEDPTWLAEQISHAGLEPWRVKRVYAVQRFGTSGAISLVTAQLAGRLGRSLADLCAGPRGLIDEQFCTSPETIAFRLVVDRSGQEENRRDFFSGIALPPGGDARRPLAEPSAEVVQLVQRVAQKRRNMQAILERATDDSQQGLSLAAQAADLARGLDPDSAAHVLYHLAQRYYRTGHWREAAEVFQMLAERYPDHFLARPASVWLVQYYASGEAAVRQRAEAAAIQQVAAPPIPARSFDVSSEATRWERAAALGRQLAQTQPALAAEPAVGFALAAADRRRGQGRLAERFYLSRSRTSTRDAWWSCAQGEQWLVDPRGTPPKPVVRCMAAAGKPRLDGRLDDAVWQQARPVELTSPHHDDADWGGVVLLAYDKEFLYVAIRCRQAPGVSYPPARGPRPRDPDLSAYDRVELLVDLDRDYGTYYRLVIDSRGAVSEDCWGDATWNPQWFVAATTADGHWSAEAAIGWSQLAGQPPSTNAVWALGIQRIVPGVGFQSWNHPAAVEAMPEGFGYLVFE